MAYIEEALPRITTIEIFSNSHPVPCLRSGRKYVFRAREETTGSNRPVSPKYNGKYSRESALFFCTLCVYSVGDMSMSLHLLSKVYSSHT